MSDAKHLANAMDPAFPSMRPFDKFDDELGKYVEHILPFGGLTKREWMAGMVLQGTTSNSHTMQQIAEAAKDEVQMAKMIAIGSRRIADAMLEELERTK